MNHWPKHKKDCKLRAAKLRDEELFKDPPAKEECPICFLPMPMILISCISFPPATITSVPIYEYAIANENYNLVYPDKHKPTKVYYPCCGKSICKGCAHSCRQSGNIGKCPFCNSDRSGKTVEESNEDLMKRVEANDSGAISQLASYYLHGLNGVQQDQTRGVELFAKAAELGFSKAHYHLGGLYHEGGYLKKAKFHYEAAAMAGHEVARHNLGIMEANSGNMERAVKHWTIAASGGCYQSMQHLITSFEKGHVSRESINSTLAAYNNSCAEMRSEARDAFFQMVTKYAPREE
jgi:hypothetical protein